MSRTLIALLVAATLFAIPPQSAHRASGEELHQEFLDGLRKRGYYDYALYYLDKLDARGDLPAEIKQVVPYERAITLLDGAKLINSPELRDEQLDRAVAQLEAFTRDNPMHPLAGDANTQRARILIEKAHVKIWESESPANKDNREKFRLEARELLSKARETFQKAHDLHKAHYDSFPKFIPKEDQERREAWQQAEIDYMRAQIDLALCTYAEAQTYAEDSQEFQNLLLKAADEFKEIHEKYRSMVGGLYSRMWQGKCFEEQGGKDDIGKALGIYNELLDHPGKSQAMKNVQDQVLQFRLICLNHEARKDYQLVINEADEWIKQNRKLTGFTVGLGIRFQKAIAHEELAEKVETDWEKAVQEAKRAMETPPPKPVAEIEGHLRKAIVDAQAVTKYAGQYKAPSQFMISRIKGKLGLEEGDPKTIEEALVKADKMRQDIEKLEGEVAAAKTKAEKTNAQDTLNAHLNDTARVLSLALNLAEEDTDITLLNNVRFLLCYVYYKLGRHYEAGVIGEFLAKHFAKNTDDNTGKLGEIAQNAARVARAAWYEEYKLRNEEQADIDPSQRDLAFELDQMVRICEMTTSLWPSTGLADESRMTLGRIYSKREQPVQAAEWFGKVTSPEEKGVAQVSAGQAYWNAYLNGTQAEVGKRPSPEDLSKWQASAAKYLLDGLKKMNDEVPAGAKVEDATDLILARVTLAQINVYEQKYDAAIKYLTDTKEFHHAPLDAVKIGDGEERPAVGVKSQNFARLVYQVLLRAYVGKQQTDDALKAMDDLETVVGKGNADELSATYTQLGEQIGKEVKILQAAADNSEEGAQERLDTLLAAFDTFLNALYQEDRRKQMSVGSVQWMAETFLNLGLTIQDAAKAKDYFNKSVTCYKDIVSRGAGEKWLTGMKLRLANAQRSAQQFDEALATMTEVLKEYPDAPNVQSAAAQLLEDWGKAGQSDAPDRLTEAIVGRKFEGQKDDKQNGIKGWGGLTRQYAQMLGPIRGKLRELRGAEEKIIAYENTIKEKASRKARVDAAQTLGASADELKNAQDALAVITDAETATKNWIALRLERDRLKAQAKGGKAAEQDKLERIEQISRFLNHMVDSAYYESLMSGRLEEERREEIEKLKKKDSEEAQRRIAQLETFLEEMKTEKELLPPAFRTGQRIIKIREKLATLLQAEYDQLEKTLAVNSSGSSEAMMKSLKTQIDAVKPEGMDDERMKEVQEEITALANEGNPVSKPQLEQELRVLRDAINAWTVYELVSDQLPESAKPLEEMELTNSDLADALQKKRDEIAEQVAAEEAKEADLHERLLETLHHVADTRHELAKAQSSNVEKEKALRRAAKDAASVVQHVPRDDIPAEWWNKFNSTYKSIRSDLAPMATDGETINPNEEIPVPVPVDTALTWVERPSNSAVASLDAGGDEDAEKAAPPPSANMTWVIIGVLFALGGTGAAVYFMMGTQKRPPVRVTYGAGPMGGGDEKISFPGMGESAPAKRSSQPKRKPAAGSPPQKSASRPLQKKTAPSGQPPRKAGSGAPPKKAAPGSGPPPKKAAPKKRPPSSGGEPPKRKPSE